MSAASREPENSQKESRWLKFLDQSAHLRHYIKKYKTLFIIGLSTLAFVDLLEVLPPYFLKLSVDIATGDRPRNLLLGIVLGYVGVSLLQAIGRYGWRMYLVRASMYAGRDLRRKFGHHLFGLAQSFFDRRPIGELMSLATSDVEAVRNMLGAGLLTLADSIFYFLTVPVAMYLLSPKLTLLAFLPLPIIPWIVMRNEKEIHNRYEAVQEQFARLSAMTQESLNGVRVLKGFAKEEVQTERFRYQGQEFIRLNLYLARVQTTFGPTLDFAMSLGMVLLLFVGGRELIQHGDVVGAVTLGTFVAFQRYIQKMVWPMAALGMALGMYQRAISSSRRLDEILETKTDVPQSPTAITHPVEWKAQGRIEFRGLSFSFPGSDKLVLKNIHLNIEPGERVAFVGTIGSGKSALLSILPRIYPVSTGMVFVDGIDVNQWKVSALRRQIGYVGQEVFLFSETVLENLAFGLQGWRAEPTQLGHIEAATKIASVYQDVLGLSEGFQTRVGERGVNLSGGQKQRLTIARAIVQEPSILVLDDALSSVDVQTEEKILHALKNRPGKNTELISAHRITTIQDADRIVVLERGEIRQMGPHKQLLEERRGLYRKYYEQQRLEEELEFYAENLSEHVEVTP